MSTEVENDKEATVMLGCSVAESLLPSFGESALNHAESESEKKDIEQKLASKDETPVRRSLRKVSKEAQQRVIEAARGITRPRKAQEKNEATAKKVAKEAKKSESKVEEKSAESGPIRRSLRQRTSKDKEDESSESVKVKKKEPKANEEKSESTTQDMQTQPRKRGRPSLKGKINSPLNTLKQEEIKEAEEKGQELTDKESKVETYPTGSVGGKNVEPPLDVSTLTSAKGHQETGELLESIKKEEDGFKKNADISAISTKSAEKDKDEESDSESGDSELDDGELEDEDDSDFDPEEDPHKLYCICNKPHGNRFMICCDKCEEWFHGDCVGITITRGREMDKNDEEWICPRCKGLAPKKPALAIKSQHPHRVFKVQHSTENHKVTKEGVHVNLAKKDESRKEELQKKEIKFNRSSLLPDEKAKHRESQDNKVEDGMKISLREINSRRNSDPSFSSKPSKDQENSADKTKREATEEPAGQRSRSASADLTKLDIKKDPKQGKKAKHNAKTPVESPSLDQTFTYEKIKDLKLKRQHSLDLSTESAADVKAVEEKNSEEGKHGTEEEEFPRKKKAVEQRFRIPKKVRTTPTPKSFKPVPNVRLCINEGCQKQALKNAIYCSSKCIARHTEQCIILLEEERQRKFGAAGNETVKSATDSVKGTNSSEVAGDEGTLSHRFHANDRIAVVEKSSGKLMAGVMAPTKEKLISWLEEHPTYEVLTTGKTTAVQKKEKKDQDDIVRNNVKRSLKDTLMARCREVELTVDSDEVMKLAHVIEEEMFGYFGDTGQKYKTKYRSLIFNLKDHKNRILYKRVVLGDINPEKLVRMSPEQLASSELAKWREREAKHNLEMIKKREEEEASMSKHAVKKTHKGEIEIDEDSNLAETLEVKADASDPKAQAQGAEGALVLEDTTEQHTTHLFDLNCKICTGKLTPPGEKHTVVSGHISTTIADDITEASVPSPPEDDRKQRSPGLVEFSYSINALPLPNKEASVWKGFIMMQNVAKFVTRAYRVSGTCDNLLQILPDTIHVCGRIPHEEVWDYLYQLKSSTNKVIDVLRFEMASADEKPGYVALYSYFYTRKRIGVVGNCYSGVKDMYLVPLASHDPVPPELRPFDGPGLPSPRPHMLLGIIIRLRQLGSKRAKGQAEKHDTGKRRRKSSLSTPPDSPMETADQIVYSHSTTKKTSSKSSASSSESSSTPTPDLGSPMGSANLASSLQSALPHNSKHVTSAAFQPSSELPPSVPSQTASVGSEGSVSLPSILTDIIAPITSTIGIPKPEVQPTPDENFLSAPESAMAVSMTAQVASLASVSSSSAVQVTSLSAPTTGREHGQPDAFPTLSTRGTDILHGLPSGNVMPPTRAEVTQPELQPLPTSSAGETKPTSAEDEPYDPEDEFVIDLIEDIPLPSRKDKDKLLLPLDMPRKVEEKRVPALPPLPLPGVDRGDPSLGVGLLGPGLLQRIDPLQGQPVRHPRMPMSLPETYRGERSLHQGSIPPNVGIQPRLTPPHGLPEPRAGMNFMAQAPPIGLPAHDHALGLRPLLKPVSSFDAWPKEGPQRPLHVNTSHAEFAQFTPRGPDSNEPHIVPVSPVALSAPEPKPWITEPAVYSQISPPSEGDEARDRKPDVAREVHTFLREARQSLETSTSDPLRIHGRPQSVSIEHRYRSRSPLGEERHFAAHAHEDRHRIRDTPPQRWHNENFPRSEHAFLPRDRGRYEENFDRAVRAHPSDELSDKSPPHRYPQEHHLGPQGHPGRQSPPRHHSRPFDPQSHHPHEGHRVPPYHRGQRFAMEEPPSKIERSPPPHQREHRVEEEWRRGPPRELPDVHPYKGEDETGKFGGPHPRGYPPLSEREAPNFGHRLLSASREYHEDLGPDKPSPHHGRDHPQYQEGDAPHLIPRSDHHPMVKETDKLPGQERLRIRTNFEERERDSSRAFPRPFETPRDPPVNVPGLANRGSITSSGEAPRPSEFQGTMHHPNREEEVPRHKFPPHHHGSGLQFGARVPLSSSHDVDEHRETLRVPHSSSRGPPLDQDRHSQGFPQASPKSFGRARGRGFDSGREHGVGRAGPTYPGERGGGRGRGHYQRPEEGREWHERRQPGNNPTWSERQEGSQDRPADRESEESYGHENRFSVEQENAPWRHRRTADSSRFQRGPPGRGAWQ